MKDKGYFGSFEPQKVFIWLDGPRTFSLLDQDGQLCFAHWLQEVDNIWQFVARTRHRQRYLQGIAATMTSTSDIVAKLWSLCHVLRDDGITYHEYVTELTFLLFLKMMKETEQEKLLPTGYGRENPSQLWNGNR